VLPTVCATIGSLMATEVIKLIALLGRPLLGRVTSYDALGGGFREISYEADPDAEPITELIDYEVFCGTKIAAPERGTMSDANSPSTPTQTELTPAELSDLLTDGVPVQLIDVREPWEAELASIPGARLIPLGSLNESLPSLDPATPVVAYCHSGVRSGMALQTLLAAGFDAKHLVGGIDAWSRVIDPTVARY
jgi:rhodanese-related sulfurtransferase